MKLGPRRRSAFWLVQSLTVARVAFAFIFVVLAPIAESKFLACTIYILAWLSDFLDGYTARKWGVSSRFGGAMDVFGDRYLLVLSCIYAGFRGIYIAALAIIVLREMFSVAMRMVQVRGSGIIISNKYIGGIVHITIAVGTLFLLLMPEFQPNILNQFPFVAVALFYVPYFPYTIYKSWAQIIESIKADVSDF